MEIEGLDRREDCGERVVAVRTGRDATKLVALFLAGEDDRRYTNG